jgi:hypothetical protein
LSEQKDKIWSVGITDPNGNGWEQFSDPREDKTANLHSFMKERSGEFAEEQIKRGSFNELERNISSGNIVGERELVENTFSRLKNKAILIQNANFENKFLGGALGEGDAGLSDIFRYNTRGARSPNKKLFAPPAVGNILDEIKMAKGSGANISEIAGMYDSMLGEYSKEFARQDGKSFTIDLMHISSAVFAKAANKGLLDEKMYDANLKVDFLSERFGLGKELHTALSDGLQQESIFYRLLDINEEIDSGSLSDKTINELADIKTRAKDAAKSKFRSELNNIVGEINRNGGTRLIDDTPTSLLTIDIEGPEGVTKRQVPRYSSARTTGNIEEAVEFISHKYNRHLDSDSIKEIVNEHFSSSTDKVREKINKSVENIIGESKVETKMVDSTVSIPKIFEDGRKVKNSLLAISGGIVALSALSGYMSRKSDNAESTASAPKSKQKSIFDTYDEQRFKNNEELNRHHYM